MTQWYRQVMDLTYPITSMFSGRGFNQTIRETFGDVYIEDLWTPYFTLTTDITASCSRVHTNGEYITMMQTLHVKFFLQIQLERDKLFIYICFFVYDISTFIVAMVLAHIKY